MTTPRKINVLMVEDTKEHVVLMRRALERGKLEPQLFIAADGQAALDFLHRQGVYADDPRPDLIFLDLSLPRISGLEVLKHIKNDAKLKDIPVVILTVSDEGKDIIRSYKGGADSYFTKSALFLKNGTDPTAILETVMAMVGV